MRVLFSGTYFSRSHKFGYVQFLPSSMRRPPHHSTSLSHPCVKWPRGIAREGAAPGSQGHLGAGELAAEEPREQRKRTEGRARSIYGPSPILGSHPYASDDDLGVPDLLTRSASAILAPIGPQLSRSYARPWPPALPRSRAWSRCL